ncbi:MAG: DNA polymerase III subunit beta [Pyrinomonas sp.]|uniref:DNA polymerase III subunit beta n=1 Tax=Pyrinomonas sp. TaxID=2080306 RepID=UPI003331219A
MEFAISKGSLQRELQFLQGVVEKRSTLPVLANILVESVGNDRIRLWATDLDTTLRCEAEAEILTSGRMLIGARKLFDVVRSLPDQTVHFRREANDWVELRCAASRFRIAGQRAEDFPQPPTADAPSPIRISAVVLRTMIERTIFAITLEESRYTLSGAKFTLAPEDFRMVTTDGHRLAFIERRTSTGARVPIDALVPRKTLSELVRIASAHEGEIALWADQNHIFFEAGPRFLIGRKLVGQFPNYEMVIPKNNPWSVRLGAAPLAEAIRRVALMADDRSRAIKLTFAPGTLVISAQTAEEGSSEETLVTDYHGEPLEIGFNAQYLLDFLQVLDQGEVAFEFKDPNSQAQLRPTDDQEYDYRYVVMPMRLT